MSENTPENDVYEGYSVDAEDQPTGDGESMTDARGLSDPLDEGYSPPEKWSAGQGWGNTPLEGELGESFEQRLAQEEPEPDPYDQPQSDDPEAPNYVENLGDGEVGGDRSGRLVAPDEGLGEDEDQELIAEDIGIDGAGASAEEAAMHVVEDD